MATYYVSQFIGVKDGTVPPQRADGRVVGAKESQTLGSKVAGQAWASGDKIYIGEVRSGELLIGVSALSDTTLGTTTLSIGTLLTPTKYVNAQTFTPVNIKTPLGPTIATILAGPLTADEDIYVTLGVGGVAAGINIAFFLQTLGVR